MTIRNIKYSARLALNNYTRYLDEKLNYIPYFYMFTGSETFGAHCEWDFGDATGRYLDALLLCSEIAGKDVSALLAANRLKAALDIMMSPYDGLCYRPGGLTWVSYGANSFDQRSCLLGLSSWYKHFRDDATRETGENLIRGLYRMGIEIDDYFYIPVEYYTQSMDKSIFEPREFDINECRWDPCHYGGGVLIYPLMYWYSLTGSGEALKLAGKLTRFIVHHSGVFAGDGSFWVKGLGIDSDGHFHSRMDTTAGIMEFAAATGDNDLISWCRRVYDWAVGRGTRYGLFPEGLGLPIVTGDKDEYPDVSRHSETCGTADMIELALLLGKYVDPSYYDHAERYLNHLLASQLDDISWIAPSPDKPDTETVTYRDVAERYRGSFTGRITPNDLTNYGRYDNMGCCSAAGGRGLYMLWSNTAEENEDSLSVNLWLDVDNSLVHIENSYDKGMISITPAKDYKRVCIRIPSWLSGRVQEIKAIHVKTGSSTSDSATIPESVHSADNLSTAGDGCRLSDSGYLVFENINGGEMVQVSYPVFEQEDIQHFCGEKYKVCWQGNRVVEVLPKGGHIPLYVRS